MIPLKTNQFTENWLCKIKSIDESKDNKAGQVIRLYLEYINNSRY